MESNMILRVMLLLTLLDVQYKILTLRDDKLLHEYHCHAPCE